MTLKNLERLNAQVRSAVEAYCQKLVSVLGPNAKSISVYGSATGPDYVHGTSNVNLVIVLEKLDQSVLATLLGIVKWGKKKNIVAPLLLTPEYIRSSLDVFPMEFAEIKDSQVSLLGEDFFSSIEITPDHLRLECESQLKAAVLRTRQAYLEIGLTKKGAESVLHASLNSLIPVFRSMLRLKGIEVPARKLEVVNALGSAFGIDTSTFAAVLHDKAGDEKIGGREAHQVLARYILEIENLAGKADNL